MDMWCYDLSQTALSPQKQAPFGTEYEAWSESTNGRTGQEEGLLPLKGTETCSLNRRLIATNTELPRLRINYAAVIVSYIKPKVRKKKQKLSFLVH
jgi:hypothetical protein